MEVIFKTNDLADLYKISIKQLRGKQKYPLGVIKKFKERIDVIRAANSLNEVRQYSKSFNLEELKGDRKGEYSIRLNDQYRLIFVTEQEQTLVIHIKEISKHYE